MDNFVTLYFEVAGSLCSVHFHSNVHIRRCRKCLYLLHVLFINYRILTWWEFSFHVLVGSSAAQTEVFHGSPQYEAAAAAHRLPHIIPDCSHPQPFQFMSSHNTLLWYIPSYHTISTMGKTLLMMTVWWSKHSLAFQCFTLHFSIQ